MDAFIQTLSKAIKGWALEFNDEGKITYSSINVESFLGYKTEELVGNNVYDFMNAEDAIELKETLRTSEAAKIVVTSKFINRKGNVVKCTMSIFATGNSDNEADYVTIVKVDTDRERLQKIIDFSNHLNNNMTSYTKSELLRESINKIIELTGSEYGFVAFVDEYKQRMYFEYFNDELFSNFGISRDDIEREITFSFGFWGYCLSARATLVANEFDVDFDNDAYYPFNKVKINNAMVIPVFDKENIVGIFSVGNKKSDYTDDDNSVMTNLAQHIWETINKRIDHKDFDENNEKLTLALELGEIGMYEWNPITGECFVSNKWLSIMGLTRNLFNERYPVLSTETLLRYSHEDDHKDVLAAMEAHFEDTSKNMKCEYRILSGDGTWRWVSLIGKTVEWTDEGAPLRVVGYQQNIHQRKMAEMRIKEQEKQYRTLFEFSSDALLIVDVKEGCLKANEALVELYGYESESELVGKKTSTLMPKIQDDGTLTENFLNHQLEKTLLEEKNSFECRQLKANGDTFYGSVTLTAIEEDDRVVILSRIKDITEEKERENSLNYMSRVDALTDLANRRYFNEKLTEEWNRLLRNKKPLSLIMGDIDHFKMYNDTYGHVAGDDVLREVAGMIKTVVNRPSDLPCRYGGEEFAIILPETDYEGAMHIANQLRKAIEDMQIESKNSKTSNVVTMSFGVSTMIPEQDSSTKELIESADTNLYDAKESGRNRVK